MSELKQRPWPVRVGDWLSQGLNTVVLNGEPDESTSGRSYRQGVIGGHAGWCRMRRFVDWLFTPVEAEHCKKAYEIDLKRAQARLKRAGKVVG